MSQFAIKWILMQKAVSTVIAEGKIASQVQENVKASALQSLPAEVMRDVVALYSKEIKPQVHQRW